MYSRRPYSFSPYSTFRKPSTVAATFQAAWAVVCKVYSGFTS